MKCPGCGIHNPERSRLVPGVESRRRQLASAESRPAERRQTTVLFADLVRSIRIADRIDPSISASWLA
jgi:class 3 adenylate cyclase